MTYKTNLKKLTKSTKDNNMVDIYDKEPAINSPDLLKFISTHSKILKQ